MGQAKKFAMDQSLGKGRAVTTYPPTKAEKMYDEACKVLKEIIDDKHTLEKMEFARLETPLEFYGKIESIKPNQYKEGRYQVVITSIDDKTKKFFTDASVFPEKEQAKIMAAFNSMQLRLYGPGAPNEDRLFDFAFSSGFRLLTRRDGTIMIYMDLAPKDRFSEEFTSTKFFEDMVPLENITLLEKNPFVFSSANASHDTRGRPIRFVIYPRIWMMVESSPSPAVRVGLKPVVDGIHIIDP